MRASFLSREEANRTLATEGRLCQELAKGLTCCLPCPITDWVYADYFNTSSDVASWVSVVGIIACAFLLFSYAFLPVEKTGRHYLSISIVCAVVFMHVRFNPFSLRPASERSVLMRLYSWASSFR